MWTSVRKVKVKVTYGVCDVFAGDRGEEVSDLSHQVAAGQHKQHKQLSSHPEKNITYYEIQRDVKTENRQGQKDIQRDEMFT